MTSTDRNHALAIGARLRRVRHQQDLSLADVQARSSGRWKAVVVGAYERGDRSVTVERLAELAEFYDVPLADLLPDPQLTRAMAAGRVTLDLTRLADAPARPELAVLARYAGHVARKRGDHNGRVLTLRTGDLETVALVVDRTAAELRELLEEAGVLLHLDVTGGVSDEPEGTRRALPGGSTEVAEEDLPTITIDLRDDVYERDRRT
jgi:transcriptional regulator with XRE-family HTH domain